MNQAMKSTKEMLNDYAKELANEPVEYWTEEVNDNCLELLLIKDTRNSLAGVIIVACTGGPHLELNTRDLTITGYWSGEKTVWHIDATKARAITEYYAEIY